MASSIRFVICIQNDEYEGALEVRKIYEVLPDSSAEKRNYIRVIDESGEDYLYPAKWFLPIELPQNVEDALLQLASK